jgi:protein-tyrosine phosphatase
MKAAERESAALMARMLLYSQVAEAAIAMRLCACPPPYAAQLREQQLRLRQNIQRIRELAAQ